MPVAYRRLAASRSYARAGVNPRGRGARACAAVVLSPQLTPSGAPQAMLAALNQKNANSFVQLPDGTTLNAPDNKSKRPAWKPVCTRPSVGQ